MTREITEVVVDRLGAGGDGVAEHDGQRLFIGGGLPGERLKVRLGPSRGEGRVATIVERLTTAEARVEPPCDHFGRCGGCALQHVQSGAYAEWKRSLVVDALAKRGLGDTPVDKVLVVPPGDRRRATFTAVGRKGGVALGFSEAASHAIVDIADCAVVLPDLVRLLPSLRVRLSALLAPGTRIQLVATATESGVDLLLEGELRLDLRVRELLAELAESTDLARLSLRRPGGSAETVVERRLPVVRFDGTPAELPPGAFLQASRAGEAALIAAVLEGVGTAERVLDLYAGIGTFSLPLTRRAKVTAMEGDAEAVHALSRSAAARAGHLSVERRDLARDPPAGHGLERFDAVVFDPPRAGARAVAEALAGARVPVAVAVSCNPSTFARDARILVDGGYRLERVRPVDQFLWSPHVELIAYFRREGP